MARSITTGGGKAVKVEVHGLKELRATMRDLLQGIANEKDLSPGRKASVTRLAQQMIQSQMGEAALMIRNTARANAQSARWPRAVVRAIFKYSDLTESERKKMRSALVGVRTGAPRIGRPGDIKSGPGRAKKPDGIYVEWNAKERSDVFVGPRRRGQRGMRKAAAGRKLGMSIGRIMESGTIHNTPTTAFQRAVAARRAEALRRVSEGYKKAIAIVRGRME